MVGMNIAKSDPSWTGSPHGHPKLRCCVVRLDIGKGDISKGEFEVGRVTQPTRKYGKKGVLEARIGAKGSE